MSGLECSVTVWTRAVPSSWVTAGIVGFLLRRSGYSIPGIVLGIILGKIGEQNFAQGMQMVHYDLFEYFSRPICSILILAGALTLLTGIYKAIKQSRSTSAEWPGGSGGQA